LKPDTVIELHNNGAKKFESMWDSKPFTIAKGKHVEVVKGLADHFINLYPKAGLEIKEMESEPIEPREPVNPLTDNNRGNAFEGIDD
jgi:hypothetical protein